MEESATISTNAQENSRMGLALEYSDVEMTTANEGSASEDDDYVLVGQSDEVRRLKQQQRQLKSQLKTGVTADIPEKVKEFVAKGPEALKPQYTVSLSQFVLIAFYFSNSIRFLWLIPTCC